ncbi:MAG TPA: ACP S-malonyltransferase [Gaiellaceae bacterium]|nr:ACP S-malonyltransferase [Gaiellaceae bacterium]
MTKVAFCFPGQGSLEAGMGKEIARAFSSAREVYRVGSEASGLDLERLCFDSPLEELVDTEVQQPALVATSLAILAALRERGLEPDVVVGHSVGEFAALAAAGAIGTGEAIGLVRERGLAMAEAARQRPGTMAAILGLADEEVEKLCRKIVGVWPANYNCPGQIVISGEHEAVEECCAEAESLGARRAVRLKVSGAFHSPLVARAADRLRPAVERVRFGEPLSPFMSTVTAKIEPAKELATLLVDQLTAPVRFTQAATELIRSGATTFVEVGPGSVLSGLVKRIDRGVKTISVNTVESLERAQEALTR